MYIYLTMWAIVFGTLATLPIWIFWLIQKLLHRQPSKLKWVGVVLVGVFSFLVVVCIYAYFIIVIDYVFSIVSPISPSETEKIEYENDAITEAFQRSIIPPIFQKPCIGKPEVVCKLGMSYALKLWDTNLMSDGEPLFGGLVSSIVSMLLINFGNFVFRS